MKERMRKRTSYIYENCFFLFFRFDFERKEKEKTQKRETRGASEWSQLRQSHSTKYDLYIESLIP